MKKIILFCLIIASCKAPEDCDKFYNKYVNLQLESKDSESLVELDKAIKCNPNNEDYLFEKVRYFIKLDKFSDAKDALLNLGEINNIYVKQNPLRGLLEIKSGNTEIGKKELEQVFKNLSKLEFNKENFNDYFNYLLLKNYFGKLDSRLTVDSIKGNYNEEYELNLLRKFKEMKDLSKDSLEMLNKFFNLEELNY